MHKIVLIAHNIRSTHNIGSLLRTADGLGVNAVYMTGYSPYPKHDGDIRMPHIANKISRDIHKTALNAEKIVSWKYISEIDVLLQELKKNKYEIIAIEQTPTALPLQKYRAKKNVALLLGNEVTGIEQEILQQIKTHLYIPMYGAKESFNVVQAAAMALYHFRFLI